MSNRIQDQPDIIHYEELPGLRLALFHRIEIAVWMLLTALCLSRLFAEKTIYNVPWDTVIPARYTDLLLAFFVMMFPIVFQLVFGRLPLEAIRLRRLPYIILDTTGNEDQASVQTVREQMSEPLTAEQLLLNLAVSSKNLANGIYGRSGVYLLVGVMVAFSGLAFFYTQTSRAFDTKEVTALLISLAPKFGILFFIEFVAFFFLRQYRTSMDEFRYYEAIKRRREEMLALVKLGAEQSKPIDPFELVKLGQFFSIAGRLEKEETTELLEARKLEKNETAVLEKAIDAIAQARK